MIVPQVILSPSWLPGEAVRILQPGNQERTLGSSIWIRRTKSAVVLQIWFSSPPREGERLRLSLWYGLSKCCTSHCWNTSGSQSERGKARSTEYLTCIWSPRPIICPINNVAVTNSIAVWLIYKFFQRSSINTLVFCINPLWKGDERGDATSMPK